jgi:peptidoglycan/xylan/chitin deacetylase (PgdA/CDA1 family)
MSFDTLRDNSHQYEDKMRSSPCLRLLRTAPLLPMLVVLAAAPGCKKQAGQPAAALPPPPPPPEISQIDLKSYKPNEAGAVMVLMYHDVLAGKPDNDLNRTPDSFRKDLEELYKRKYHPVNAIEFVTNTMDVPAGKTPVVLTFDDARMSQFKVVVSSEGSAKIDKDCAVGIMETFSKKHPDWPLKATFFVLPKEGPNGDPFGQPESVSEKFEYLVSKGYEVANHTSTHASFRKIAPDKMKWELATAVKDIKAINPQAQMQTLALPYGHEPPKALTPAVIEGESGGTEYENRAIFKAAWRPNLSPITKDDKSLHNQPNFTPFNPLALERSVPDPKRAKMAGTFEYWLKWFDQNPSERYISDGNPKVAAIPESKKALVDRKRADKSGVRLQFYSLTGSKSGGGLSVQ